MERRRPKTKRRPSTAPVRRERTVRVADEVARQIRGGHPWIYRDALQGRELPGDPGVAYDVVDLSGAFVARAVYDPQSNLALRAFSREAGAKLDAGGVATVVAAAARRRRSAIDVTPTSAFRALAGDSEGLPAVNVDGYGHYFVATLYSAVAERYEKELIAALQTTWAPAAIYLQRRYRPTQRGRARPGAELVAGDAAPTDVIVAEGRTRFIVDVTAPLGTGLFGDMRRGREAVARHAAGRRVINCFSYTGAFSVVAAVHGATSVTSVDAAARAHGRARKNFAANGLDGDDKAYDFITGDTFATLARLAERNRRFDLAIVDPPTFSAGSPSGPGASSGGPAKARPFSAVKDYPELVAAALAVLDSGGLLLAACNTIKLNGVDFDRAFARGAAIAGRRLLHLESFGSPADYAAVAGFPEGDYLKVRVLQVA